MEAGMCSCDYDGDSPKFFEDREVTARKDHLCCECNEQIKKGEKYRRARGLWEEFDEYKTCLICWKIREDYCAPLGDLWSTLKEVLGDDIA